MNNVEKFSKILENMQSIMDTTEWISSIGTCLDTYLKDLSVILKTYFEHSETFSNGIDLEDSSHRTILSNNVSHRTNPSSNVAKLRQRLNFYQLLGIFERVNNKYVYIINSTEFLYENNVVNTFVNTSIRLIKLFNENNKKYADLKPSIRMFFGMYVYILKIASGNHFIEILDTINDKTSHKIKDFLSIKKFNSSDTFESTYKNFYNNYFKGMNFEDLTRIALKLAADDAGDWFAHEHIKQKTENITNERMVELIKVIKITNNQRDTTNEKIKMLLRADFRNNLIKLNNGKSDLSVNNKKIENSIFLEAAHVIPINKTLEIINDLIPKDEKKLEKIIDICRSHKNGMLIPFSFHRLYDNEQIEISKSRNQFILTPDGSKNLNDLELLGFNINNEINQKKYDGIIELINEFDNIINDLKN